MSDIKLKPCPGCNGQAEMGYGDGCYYVYCTHCNTCGAGEVACSPDDEEKAAAAWNSLPRHLQWTTETPTQDGAYWYRSKEGEKLLAYIDNEQVTLLDFPGQEHIDFFNGQWAGPFPEPQEPK